ncbi:MAG: hypothetical protein ABJN62_19720 [Halioglobus sp.]
MTEYEMGEMMHNQMGQMWQAGQMYFTLVSAYLAVSYLVGGNLTKAQASVISILYLVWVAAVISGQIIAGFSLVYIEVALDEINSIALPFGTRTPLNMYLFMFVQIAGVLASLWFMWSVRHPKAE